MAGLGLARLGKELKMLTDEPPPGVCAWPVDDCITHLQAREYCRLRFYECFGNDGPGYSLRLKPPEGLSASPGLILADCALITLCLQDNRSSLKCTPSTSARPPRIGFEFEFFN